MSVESLQHQLQELRERYQQDIAKVFTEQARLVKEVEQQRSIYAKSSAAEEEEPRAVAQENRGYVNLGATYDPQAEIKDLRAQVQKQNLQIRVLQEQMRELLSLEVPEESSPITKADPSPKTPQKQTSPGGAPSWELEAQTVGVEPSIAPSTVGERMELAMKSVNTTVKHRLLFVGDRFHNLYELRQPSALGLIFTLLLPPTMIAYMIYWIIKYNSDPPLEEVNIRWSMAYSPFPFWVECHSEHCWFSLSDCFGSHGAENDICMHATKGQTVSMQMCYSMEPSGGLHLVWSNSTAQDHAPEIQAWVYTGGDGEPVARHTRARLHPGLQLGTYVHTVNMTRDEDDHRRESHEWFSTYVSPTTSAQTKPGACDTAVAAAAGEKAVGHFSMEASYVYRKIEKPAPYGPFIGDVGGTYSLLSSLMLGAYLVLWRGVRTAKTVKQRTTTRSGSTLVK